jgi:hypothetical protein
MLFHLAASVQRIIGDLTGKSKGNLGVEQNHEGEGDAPTETISRRAR